MGRAESGTLYPSWWEGCNWQGLVHCTPLGRRVGVGRVWCTAPLWVGGMELAGSGLLVV